MYLRFRCPCAEACQEVICVPFTPALDGTEAPPARRPWKRTGGSTLDDLSLQPSIWFHGEEIAGSNCKGWHGYLTNGELRPC